VSLNTYTLAGFELGFDATAALRQGTLLELREHKKMIFSSQTEDRFEKKAIEMSDAIDFQRKKTKNVATDSDRKEENNA
jgi:tryptophanyl-tRNA synthetase